MDTIVQARRFCTAFLLILLGIWTACTPPSPRNTYEADVRSITETEASWLRPWSTRDVARIVSYYEEDANLVVPNMAPVVGREPIREIVQQIVRDGNFAFTFEAARVEAAKSGDYGFVQGSYALTMTDPATKQPFMDRGTYLRIYRKQTDGPWKIVQDIRASKLPAR